MNYKESNKKLKEHIKNIIFCRLETGGLVLNMKLLKVFMNRENK